MDGVDVASWILVGILIGGLAVVWGPQRTLGGVLSILGAGVLGALLGGWGWVVFIGRDPWMFLGCIVLGVLGTLIVLSMLGNITRTRYGH